MESCFFATCRIFRELFRVIATNRNVLLWSTLCLTGLGLLPKTQAEDVTFNKTRYSSVKQPKEAEVVLTVADSKVLIKGKKVNGLNIEIPFPSIDSMSYEQAARHRTSEGAGVMLLSPGTGLVLMATKTKSHLARHCLSRRQRQAVDDPSP